jgi:hypothetical protein
MRRASAWLTCALLASAWLAATVYAQPAPRAPANPREAAPIDLTGQWVAIVNEDWRWRMVTPPKGDYASVPLNEEGRRVAADQWDPSQDGDCKAFGAPALLRLPTRLRIRWEGDDRLVLETDAGRQTRHLAFRPPEPGPRSLQGQSVARWVRPPQPAGGPGLAGAGGGPPARGGYLEVKTTNLSGGWLRRNGVPYSEDAELTEYFARFAAPNGDEWLIVTTIVEDAKYLTQRFIVSNHFRREQTGGQWNPKPCRAGP